MYNEYPNPWDFSNIDKNLTSSNRLYKIEFRGLSEIAMGAPLGGECYLNIDNLKLLLNKWCAGPVIWNNSNTKIALPVWTKIRKQKIEIVDIEKKTIIAYKREFSVLHFKSFVDNLLQGIDSPIYNTRKLFFDLENEEIENIREIKL